MDIDWEEPESIDEAEDRQRTLIAEIQDIQIQFGDPRKKRRGFENEDEYWAWRQSAKVALARREQELRLVKLWIKRNRPSIKQWA